MAISIGLPSLRRCVCELSVQWVSIYIHIYATHNHTSIIIESKKKKRSRRLSPRAQFIEAAVMAFISVLISAQRK